MHDMVLKPYFLNQTSVEILCKCPFNLITSLCFKGYLFILYRTQVDRVNNTIYFGGCGVLGRITGSVKISVTGCGFRTRIAKPATFKDTTQDSGTE